MSTLLTPYTATRISSIPAPINAFNLIKKKILQVVGLGAAMNRQTMGKMIQSVSDLTTQTINYVAINNWNDIISWQYSDFMTAELLESATQFLPFKPSHKA
ncbi:MAG: hypothetical protein ACYCSS_04360 [Sulfuriferula sp.]